VIISHSAESSGVPKVEAGFDALDVGLDVVDALVLPDRVAVRRELVAADGRNLALDVPDVALDPADRPAQITKVIQHHIVRLAAHLASIASRRDEHYGIVKRVQA
jgi:hypothetical protein